MTMLTWLYDKGLVKNDCVLCFDGFLIPKSSNIDDKILRLLEAEVENKTKFKIKLKKKHMNSSFG